MVNWNHPRFVGLRLALYVIIPLILLALPADYFDTGKSICLSVLLLGRECYGCGMTRGIMHLIHFDFADAVYFNPLSLIVFPILGYLWIKYFLTDWKTYKRPTPLVTGDNL